MPLPFLLCSIGKHDRALTKDSPSLLVLFCNLTMAMGVGTLEVGAMLGFCRFLIKDVDDLS